MKFRVVAEHRQEWVFEVEAESIDEAKHVAWSLLPSDADPFSTESPLARVVEVSGNGRGLSHFSISVVRPLEEASL